MVQKKIDYRSCPTVELDKNDYNLLKNIILY